MHELRAQEVQLEGTAAPHVAAAWELGLMRPSGIEGTQLASLFANSTSEWEDMTNGYNKRRQQKRYLSIAQTPRLLPARTIPT